MFKFQAGDLLSCGPLPEDMLLVLGVGKDKNDTPYYIFYEFETGTYPETYTYIADDGGFYNKIA